MTTSLRFPIQPETLPEDLALTSAEIQLWCAPLDAPGEVVESFWRLLSAAENARAERFRFGKHRRRYVLSQGLLRLLLSSYTGFAPEQIQFEHGPRGKPLLAGGPQFNMAHSEELVLLGFTERQPLGVDVELLRPVTDADTIVERFFAPSEWAVYSRLPAEQRQAAFFNGWTRKEAYIKATGEGLAAPLNGFEITLDPVLPARFLGIDGDPAKARAWSLYHLEPAPGYVGAVALAGNGWRLTGRCLALTPLD